MAWRVSKEWFRTKPQSHEGMKEYILQNDKRGFVEKTKEGVFGSDYSKRILKYAGFAETGTTVRMI